MKKIFVPVLASLFLFSISVKAQQPAAAPAKPYKYVIKGGHVIDPKNNIDEVMDIAIDNGWTPSMEARDAQPARPGTNGRPDRPAEPARPAVKGTEGHIALVAKNIDPDLAVQVIDATGLYVTPGIVDIHTHNFWGTNMGGINYKDGPNGIQPDGFTLRTGVTTVVDAGSSGWRDFEKFKRQTIDVSKTRVLAFLNIIGTGMDGKGENNEAEIDAQKTGEMGLKYPDIIVGVKNAHYGNGNTGKPDGNLVPIREGIKAAGIMDGIFMLDGQLSEKTMELFRPGDIFTHIYGRDLMNEDGTVKDFVLAAREKGVIFDVGFGGSSFTFRRATPAFKAGFLPNSISSDQHINSMNTAMKDMQNIMGLFMAMGMPLQDVVAASTWEPAQEIKRPELGHLSEGAVADIAIFEVRDGKFGFWGNDGYVDGTKRIVNEITIRGGNVEYNLNGRIKPINLPQPPRRAHSDVDEEHRPALARVPVAAQQL
ncbi:amidohydrolase/deacetylase family metallohydrolase [Parapedobacter lycopersici]|uniref:amidohydrolase/deacetylase family metallohydrolase n=1 Tax=Parapedobacter lycopersici TaxID=1864939 RepID=UPI0033403286